METDDCLRPNIIGYLKIHINSKISLLSKSQNDTSKTTSDCKPYFEKSKRIMEIAMFT